MAARFNWGSNKINDLLSSAQSKQDVIDILEDVALQLQNGTFID